MSLAIRHVGHLVAHVEEYGPRDGQGRTRVALRVCDPRPFERDALNVCLRREPTAHGDVAALLDALTDEQIVSLYDEAQARHARDMERQMAWTRTPGRTGEPICEPLPDWPSPPAPPVIFLDVDGVLNREGTTERLVTPAGQRHVGIDRTLAANLARVIDATGAEIVISSSWRKHYTPPQMQALLFDAGVPCAVIGQTGGLRPPGEEPREGSIRAWLAEHSERTSWVAIDDLSLWSLEPRFVETDEREGLTRELADRAIAILSPPPAEAQLPHPAATSGTRGDSPASERARLAGGGEARR